MTAQLVARRPHPGVPGAFGFPPLERRALSNGMDVVACDMPGSGLVAIVVLLDAGAALEAPEQGGLAALAALSLLEGTTDLDADALASAIEALGGDVSARAGWEGMRIDLSIPSASLTDAVSLVAAIVRAPVFPNGGFARLRAERLGRIKQDLSRPATRARLAFGEALYAPGSLFARPVEGTQPTVETLRREDAAAFYETYATPGSTSVIVAGDFAGAAAADVVARAFDDWQRPEPARARATVTERGARGVTLIDRPGSTQSEIVIGHGGIRHGEPDFHATEALNHIFGGYFGSRINMRLREEKGFTYGCRSSFAPSREPGPFTVTAPVEGSATAESIADVLEIMRDLRDRGVTSEELDEARTYLAGILAARFETPDGVANGIAETVLYRLGDDHYTRYGVAMAVLTEEQVAEAARARLRPDAVTIAVVGDAETIGPSLERFGPVAQGS